MLEKDISNYKKMWISFVFSLFILKFDTSSAVSAPYQVSIRSNAASVVGLSNVGQILEQHICSGVFVKEKYILTTASCLYIVDRQTNLRRFIFPVEVFVVAGNVKLTGSPAGNWSNSIDTLRRSVISVIPHPGFNESSGANDIALLLLDRSLLLHHNTTSVMLIELAQLPQSSPTTPSQNNSSHPQQQQQHPGPTSVPTSNKVNENCFINIYNNSVGFSNYPYTSVQNVSFLDRWVCDQSWANPGGRAEGRCLEYRFSGLQSCSFDSRILRSSEERGTALVCNFTLSGILAEINPTPNPANCARLRRTTAYCTPIEPFREWIASEIGFLYTTAGISSGKEKGSGSSHPNVGVIGGIPAQTPPQGASWTNQQVNEAKSDSPGIFIDRASVLPKFIMIYIVFHLYLSKF
ncbi:ovochymase-2-like [Uranotaenia lowii]|uniref:ovochymase-2-like n=1 Tax=Uranotaenia lowii TaxID=190385 RepID=UPI00247A2B3E|nr:ovochymase-2-like [Uranotaenia lowii]